MKTKVSKPDNQSTSSNSIYSKNTGSDFFMPQAKLNVGQPGDKYELEADKVAESVVRRQAETPTFFAPANPLNIQSKPIAETITPLVQKAEEEEAQPKLEVQRQEEEEEAQPKLEIQRHEEEEEEMQMQPIEEEEEMLQTQAMEEEEEMLQPKRGDTKSENSSNTEQQLRSSRGNGSSLDAETRTQMESGFGADFSGVKIHTNSAAVQMNKEMGAQAFTSRNDIYFNEGKYNPATQNGKKLLAHELTHTVQQGATPANRMVQREVTASTVPAVDSSAEICDEATERAKETFILHGLYGPRSLNPSDTGLGGFEASYNPVSKILQINVLGKTSFINGLSTGPLGMVTSNESDLAELANILNYINDEVLNNTVVSNYYTWSDIQKQTAKTQFAARIRETIGLWQDNPSLEFEVDEACWDDITATVRINIDVEDEGTVSRPSSTPSGSDHLQINLVKNPARNEYGTMNRMIRETAQRIGDSRLETINTFGRRGTGARVQSGSATNPNDSSMTLSSNDLLNRPSTTNDFERSMLRMAVSFENNEWQLDSTDRQTITTFMNTFRESDTDLTNSEVTLIGHASIAGSTTYNRRLVRKRIRSVSNELARQGFPDIATRVTSVNRSDTMAEGYDNTENNAAWFRRVEIVVGSGELQNTVAHEFGHVFGLRDDYVTDNLSPGGTGTPAGTVVGHSNMSQQIGAGAVQSENSDSIMSMGNEVRAQHYGPFGWALETITSKNWKLSGY